MIKSGYALMPSNEDFMDKKFLVTGANGYVGHHVVKKLLDKGFKVSGADINFNNLDQRAERINLDIFSEDKDVFAKCGKPDVLIHLAWRDGFNHGSPVHMLDLSSHYRFIRNMVEGGLKQVVGMGSMHEVGYFEGAITGDTPTNPLSLYGIAKDSLRRSLLMLPNEFDDVVVQWIRGFYITGDDLHNNSIFSKLLQAAKEGEKTFPFTSGKNKYDFLNIEELAEDISLVAMQTKVEGVINCCSGKPLSLGERVEQFIRDNDLDIKLEYGVYPDRPYDSPGVWGDDTKIKIIRKNTEKT